MDSDAYAALLQQHIQLLSRVDSLYTVLILLLFTLIVLIVAMLFLAAWSVRAVNRRQYALEGKFTLLIEVLLKKAEREIQQERQNYGS